MVLMNQPTPTTPVMAPATIQAALASGAVASKTLDDGTTTKGTMLTAQLAPAKGPINAAAESVVVVTVKAFWQSPTVKATRNVIVLALGAGVAVIALQVTGAGTVFGLDWSKTIHLAVNAACISLAAAFSGWWMKRKDNNPVQS